jgi:hypothetical protein
VGHTEAVECAGRINDGIDDRSDFFFQFRIFHAGFTGTDYGRNC